MQRGYISLRLSPGTGSPEEWLCRTGSCLQCMSETQYSPSKVACGQSRAVCPQTRLQLSPQVFQEFQKWGCHLLLPLPFLLTHMLGLKRKHEGGHKGKEKAGLECLPITPSPMFPEFEKKQIIVCIPGLLPLASLRIICPRQSTCGDGQESANWASEPTCLSPEAQVIINCPIRPTNVIIKPMVQTVKPSPVW